MGELWIQPDSSGFYSVVFPQDLEFDLDSVEMKNVKFSFDVKVLLSIIISLETFFQPT